jgi:hypothetical protein
MRPYLEKKKKKKNPTQKNKKIGLELSLIENLPGMHEALGVNPSSAKNM